MTEAVARHGIFPATMAVIMVTAIYLFQ